MHIQLYILIILTTTYSCPTCLSHESLVVGAFFIVVAPPLLPKSSAKVYCVRLASCGKLLTSRVIVDTALWN